MKLSIVLLGGFLLVGSAAAQYKLPAYYSSFDSSPPADHRLAQLLIEVNGRSRVLRDRETMNFVRGDVLEIKAAFLQGIDRKPEHVNLVGYRKSGGQYLIDTGVPIDTAVYLSEGQLTWAADAQGTTFPIVVSTARTINGIVYLRRLDPQVKYVDVRINGAHRVMREGEPLIVGEDDKFKVTKVVTNLDENDDVEVKIVPFPSNPFSHIRSAKYYEVHFVRKKYTFGKMPLLVEQL